MKHYLGNAAVYPGNTITTGKGEIITAGSTLKLNGEFPDATDGWIVKLSPRGTALWSKRYYIAGFNSGGFFTIENATDSSYLVTGRFGKYKKRLDGTLEELDAATFLIHFDKFGNLIWMKRITNYINDSFLSSITRLSNNSFLIAGNIFNSQGSKLLLLSIDLNGLVQWQKLIRADSTQFSSPVIKQLSNGDLIITGITQKSGQNYSYLYDQGYYFLKFDHQTGALLSSTGIFINRNQTSIPTGQDNIRSIIELSTDTLLLCSSFSGLQFFGPVPGVKEAVLIKVSPDGQVYEANSYYNTQPGCRLVDAIYKNENIQMLLDNGYKTIFTETTRSGTIVNQKSYGNVYSLLRGDRLLSGQPENRFLFVGRGQYPLLGLMKTENDGAINCMETSSEMISQNVSSFFSAGNLSLQFINTSFPFAFEEYGGGIGSFVYPFNTNIDCIVTCCDNIESDTSNVELCNAQSYRLPDNSIVKESGIYYINTKNVNNCDSIAYFNIKFSKRPEINLGKDTCLKNNASMVLVADSGHSNYNWMGVNTISHTYLVTQPGKYFVTASNQCGSGTDEIEVFEECEFPVYIPTAFTPGNDGLNDDWGYPASNKNRLIRLDVFNRYGQKIFTTSEKGRRWDGRFKNVEQPAGIYAYILRAETLDGKEIVKNGTFMLIRR